MEQQPLEQALALADTQPGERVLDLSGLAGSLALRVAGTAGSVESVQSSDDLAEEGRRLASTLGLNNLFFHAGSSRALPFDAGQFSLVLWCRGLSQEPQPLAVLDEIRRVLAPRGRFVLQEITAFGIPHLDLKLWELERRRAAGHLLFYQAEEIRSLVIMSGLEVVRTESSTLTQDFDYWADATRLTPAERAGMKQTFFSLPPEHQDLIDLAFADGSISFGYPVTTVLIGSRRA